MFIKKVPLFIVFISSFALVACSGESMSIINSNVKILKNDKGQALDDCTGRTIPLRGGGAERFWEKITYLKAQMNLPVKMIKRICLVKCREINDD